MLRPAVVDTPDSDAPRRRPIYLVIALMAMWLLGMQVLVEGYQIVSVVGDPLAGAPSSIGDGSVQQASEAALMRGIGEHAGSLLPLGIARLLLGGLLVLVAAKALFVRRASPGFAVQVLLANAVLLAIGYAMEQPLRARVIEAVVPVALADLTVELPRSDLESLLRTQLWWRFRLLLGIELAALGASVLALTRKGARENLATPAPNPEEP